MAILPRYLRMRQRDWKDPFSWFNWFQMKKAETPLLFQFQGGVDPRYGLSSFPAGTFTRADASTCATYIDGNGVVQTVAANIPRYQHVDPSNPSLGQLLLLEGSRTNALTYSRDLTNAAWTKTASLGTALNATGVDGAANSASTITEANATQTNYAYQTITGLTDNTGTAIQACFKAGNLRSWAYIETNNKGGVTSRQWYNLSTGVLGTATGATNSLPRIEPLTNGWYRCSLTMNAGSGASAVTVVFGMSAADATQSYAGNGTGTILVDATQIEKDKPTVSSWIPTTSAAVTRSADVLPFSFAPLPQAMTVYADAVVNGSLSLSNSRVWQIGTTVSGEWALVSNYTGTMFGGVHSNGTATVASQMAAAPTFGQRAELRYTQDGTGAVQLGQSIAGAAETTGALSGASNYTSAYSATTLYVNMDHASANQGFLALRSLKVAAGVRSLDVMRAL